MPLNSINTNVGAMVAIQTFNAINAEMAEVQLRLTTGLKVNGPKDNPAVWAIAQNERAEVAGLDSVKDSLNRGQSIVGVAMNAATEVSDLLNQMKALAVSAADFAPGDPSRLAINDSYLALKKQIDSTVSNSDFNGVNLLSAGTQGQVRALANTNATSTIDVNHIDMSTTGALLSGLPTDLTGTVDSTTIGLVGSAITNVNNAIGKLGTGSKALDMHLDFVSKQQDTLEGAIGNLVDADMAREAARFQALQVRQQLAVQAMQIANRQPSLLLQLFNFR